MVVFSRWLLEVEEKKKSNSLLLCFVRRKKSNNSGTMRIADVLSERDDGDEEGEAEEGDNGGIKRKRGIVDSPSAISYSARCLMARWLPKIGKKTKKKMKEADPVSRVSDSPASSEEIAVVPPTDSLRSSELSIDSARKQEDSFNLGMGVGLIFLLAKSSDEYHKMVEMREQMEMLLKEIRGEVQRKHTIACSSESNNNISFSSSRYRWDLSTSKTNPMPTYSAHYVLDEAKSDVESDRESKYAIDFENTRGLSRDQMEAELEAELDRLQHDWEGESTLTLRDRVEDNHYNCDPSDDSFSYEEDNNCEEDKVPNDENPEYQGICPHELERKLHELLETRQQEKIAELEYALECAEKKLLEKKMELDLWKETQWASSLVNKDEASI